MKIILNDLFHALAPGDTRKKPLFLIAGPCVIESEKMCLNHAAALKEICAGVGILFVFKASYDKANRSAITSFRGPGIQRGLAILQKVQKQLAVPVLSDVHTQEEAAAAGRVLDILQIPALLCRQTDLLVAAGRTKKIVNVKKGQSMAPADMRNVVKKIESTGNKKILLTERGTSFGYHNLVSDMRAIPIMQALRYPVVFDATHSVQLPAAAGLVSSGERCFVATLALSAVAAGCDGLFLEVHASPERALCDGPNMIGLGDLEQLLRKAAKIREIVCGD
jgi:2-dehydro-3-deoxyphosphooctonate aldolase (KDO 8-P synthase)